MVWNSHGKEIPPPQLQAVGWGKQEAVCLLRWASSSQDGRGEWGLSWKGIWKKVPEPQKAGAAGTIREALLGAR